VVTKIGLLNQFDMGTHDRFLQGTASRLVICADINQFETGRLIKTSALK
jgi:hypothetical protein